MTHFRVLMLSSAALFSFAAQAVPLESRQAVEALCAEALSEFVQPEEGVAADAQEACEGALRGDVTATLTDEATGETTVLKLKVRVDLEDSYLLEARAVLKRRYVVADDGTVERSWYVTEMRKLRFVDRRPIDQAYLERLANLVNVSNGDWDVAHFSVSSFSLDAQIASIGEALESEEDPESCQYSTDSDLQSNWRSLLRREEHGEAYPLLERIANQGLLLAVLSRGWTEGGDSEYCSYEYFWVYLRNGFVLRLNYDETT